MVGCKRAGESRRHSRAHGDILATSNGQMAQIRSLPPRVIFSPENLVTAPESRARRRSPTIVPTPPAQPPGMIRSVKPLGRVFVSRWNRGPSCGPKGPDSRSTAAVRKRRQRPSDRLIVCGSRRKKSGNAAERGGETGRRDEPAVLAGM